MCARLAGSVRASSEHARLPTGFHVRQSKQRTTAASQKTGSASELPRRGLKKRQLQARAARARCHAMRASLLPVGGAAASRPVIHSSRGSWTAFMRAACAAQRLELPHFEL